MTLVPDSRDSWIDAFSSVPQQVFGVDGEEYPDGYLLQMDLSTFSKAAFQALGGYRRNNPRRYAAFISGLEEYTNEYPNLLLDGVPPISASRMAQFTQNSYQKLDVGINTLLFHEDESGEGMSFHCSEQGRAQGTIVSTRLAALNHYRSCVDASFLNSKGERDHLPSVIAEKITSIVDQLLVLDLTELNALTQSEWTAHTYHAWVFASTLLSPTDLACFWEWLMFVQRSVLESSYWDQEHFLTVNQNAVCVQFQRPNPLNKGRWLVSKHPQLHAYYGTPNDSSVALHQMDLNPDDFPLSGFVQRVDKLTADELNLQLMSAGREQYLQMMRNPLSWR